jgi:hypothetical protein
VLALLASAASLSSVFVSVRVIFFAIPLWRYLFEISGASFFNLFGSVPRLIVCGC